MGTELKVEGIQVRKNEIQRGVIDFSPHGSGTPEALNLPESKVESPYGMALSVIELVPDAAIAIRQAIDFCASIESVKIETAEQCAAADAEVAKLNEMDNGLEAKEEIHKRPLMNKLDYVRGRFKEAREALKNGKKKYKAGIDGFRVAEEARAAEAQRLLDEAAAAEQKRLREEADALLKQASQADGAHAEAALEHQAATLKYQASNLVAPVAKSVAPKISRASTSATRWKCVITDMPKFVAFLVENGMTESLTADQVYWNDKARDMKAEREYPGARFVGERS